MVDPWTYFLVEELIFPEESGGVTGEGAFGTDDESLSRRDPRDTGVEHAEPVREAEPPPPPVEQAPPRSQVRLSAADARRIIATAAYSLDLDEVTDLAPDVAAVLARFDGDVALPAPVGPPDGMVRSLPRHVPCRPACRPITTIADIPFGDRRDGPALSSKRRNALVSIELPALSVRAGASFLNFNSNTPACPYHPLRQTLVVDRVRHRLCKFIERSRFETNHSD
jgi:hypothetical protein